MPSQVVGVGQVNAYIKEMLARDVLLSDLWVRGELSNYKMHSSGHHYFTLKDDTGSMRAVMFRAAAQKLPFRPQSGMGVLVHGRVAVFERDGIYQLYVTEMQPDGIGAAQLALEQLKAELAAAGLLSPERKKPLPRFPRIVGVVTSATGAAWQDIQKVSFARFPGAHLALYPASVQGESAPREIAAAIAAANRHNYADVLIVGRGGGSIEDLWSFNSREVALAIADSHIPVVSAVGHEIDFTLADLVADMRAATPSAAAEMVVPSSSELLTHLAHCQTRLSNVAGAYLKYASDLLNNAQKRDVLAKPHLWLDDNMILVDRAAEKLKEAAERNLTAAQDKLTYMARGLHLLDPVSILARGYSLTYDTDGNLIRNSENVAVGDEIVTSVYSGKLYCTVTKKEDE